MGIRFRNGQKFNLEATNMDIFTLTDENGELLHPVRQAATFAKYSRSAKSARVLASKTDELSGAKFQQKWIVDYGHNAIAELAALPIAFEGVSIIASKAIEAWQRPGVCEKSTRMQEFNRDSLYVPDGIDRKFLSEMEHLLDECFALYEKILEGSVKERLREANPKMSEFKLDRAVFDLARYLLPAGCKTNLGICAFPRDVSNMISEMRGSPNPEFRDIGENLQAAAESLGGPLVRHTEPDEWINQIPVPFTKRPLTRLYKNDVKLTRSGMSEASFFRLLWERYGISIDDLDVLMQSRPQYKGKASHSVPRFFREVQLDFSVLMDYGGFRDLQRHRRMEQFVEYLTPIYGYATPPGLKDLSFSHHWCFQRLLDRFMQAPWPKDATQRMLCQYLVPMAFFVGWHVKMDLEQLYYLVELRTQEAGHTSYRDVSYLLLDEAAKSYPALTRWVRPRGPRP